MSTRKKRPTPQSMRKVRAYGELPGTGVVVDELDDGAILSAMTATKTAQVQLNATNLMTFTRDVADLFGHIVVHPGEWREKLAAAIEKVMVEHESRCLDDEVDRRVVIDALVAALNPRFEPA